jgi:catechol 2,3-dioxygenase-like lactoylglutathione lyase family enzyme
MTPTAHGEVSATILGLHHVLIAMPRGAEAAAVGFYAGVLGIPEVGKPDHLAGRGGCWFELGGIQIHLGVEDDFRPAAKAHPALLVSDLGELRLRLEAVGMPVMADEPLPGFERIYTQDPFGNRLEFLEAT